MQEELRNEIESMEYAISTFCEYTEAYVEGKLNLDEKKEELSNQIELSCGFGGELRTFLNDFEEDKMRKANQELIMRGSVGSQLPTIQEERGGDFGAAISENGGDQSSLPERQGNQHRE